MIALGFEILGVRAEPYAVVPTLMFRLRITEDTGERIHAIALRCQIQIEPRQRRYVRAEKERLFELFGEAPRWGETLQTLLWTHVTLMVPGFTGSCESTCRWPAPTTSRSRPRSTSTRSTAARSPC